MAIDVVMPRLGWGGESGTLVEWIKKDGEMVQVGDIVCTVEGDKAIDEVESMDSGILRIPPDSPPVGTNVPVGTVMAYLLEPGEPAPFEAGSAPRACRRSRCHRILSCCTSRGCFHGRYSRPWPMDTGVDSVATRDVPAISPRARRVAGELGVEWAVLQGSGRTGRIVERDVRPLPRHRLRLRRQGSVLLHGALLVRLALIWATWRGRCRAGASHGPMWRTLHARRPRLRSLHPSSGLAVLLVLLEGYAASSPRGLWRVCAQLRR